MKDQPIDVMINRSIKGKMPKGATKDQWREYNSAFQLLHTTAYGLAKEVYKGYGFCPVYDGRRKKEYFGEAFHVGVDFDSGDERSSIAYLSTVPVVRDYASFAYTTPSHTEEKPKARVVWVFEESIMDLGSYELLFHALLWKLPQADQGVKDGLRLYFGSPGCQVWGNWKLFTCTPRHELMEEYQRCRPKKVEIENKVVVLPESVSDAYLKRKMDMILDRLVNAPDGKKHPTLWAMSRLLGGYAAGGYYTFDEIESALKGAVKNNMKNVDNYEGAYQTISDGIERGRQEPLYIDRATNAGDHHG